VSPSQISTKTTRWLSSPSGWDREFESPFLQRRVCELSVPPETKRIESEQFPPNNLFDRRVGGRSQRGLDRIAERPCAAGIGSPAGKRRRIELQTRIRAEDDPAIARTRNRGANGCLAEFGVVPRNGNAAVGIVHLDHDVPAWAAASSVCPSGAARNPRPPWPRCRRDRVSRPARSAVPRRESGARN